MNRLEYIQEVIKDGESFFHIEDLDLDMKALKDMCNQRISCLLRCLPGTEEYQREYIFESVENWKNNINYLEFLEKEYMSIDEERYAYKFHQG
jgi:hypothetical protein